MKKPLFTGSGTAIVTPFTNDGTNYDVLGELIDFQIQNKTDAIIICGTTGEASTMPDNEHTAAIRYAVEKVEGQIPVIAGTTSNDTAHCVELSKHAQKLGADALLIAAPYYNKTTQRGLVKHYSMVAAAVDIPIVLYNVPSRTGLNISPQTVYELSKIENITAIKEASGDLAQAARIATLCGDNMDIYSGADEVNLPIMSLGGKGAISVVANIAPLDTHDCIIKYMQGDAEGSLKLQLAMTELIDALFTEVNPIPVKTALGLMGYNVGPTRLPLCEIGDDALEVLKKAMKNYGLIH